MLFDLKYYLFVVFLVLYIRIGPKLNYLIKKNNRMKKHVIYLIIFTTTLWYGCKKEELIKSSQIPNNNSTERFIEEVFTESRTPANAILAIEYELNMVDADTNMLKGATKYGETYLDSLSFDDLGIVNGQISAANQEALYDIIAAEVSDIKTTRFDNSSEGDVVLIDLIYDDQEAITVVVLSAAKVTDYCGCSFNTSLTFIATNPPEFDCDDFSDKLDQYYQICNVRENISNYYDFTYVPFPSIYTSGLGSTISTSQQANAISDLNSQISSYISGFNNEYVINRNHFNTVGFSNTVGVELIRAKMYTGSNPF